MSVPRVLLIPTHHTGLANAIAAAVAEIVTAQGREVRYHHVGPLAPVSAWDRWEGAVFVDPALTGDEALLSLYDVAVRHADLSLLSSCTGLLDRPDGISWSPADVADLLDCPVVVVLDCRGWGTGLKVLASGLKAHLKHANLAGAILSGVADREHCAQLRRVLAERGYPCGRLPLRRAGSRVANRSSGTVGPAAAGRHLGGGRQTGRCCGAGRAGR